MYNRYLGNTGKYYKVDDFAAVSQDAYARGSDEMEQHSASFQQFPQHAPEPFVEYAQNFASPGKYRYEHPPSDWVPAGAGHVGAPHDPPPMARVQTPDYGAVQMHAPVPPPAAAYAPNHVAGVGYEPEPAAAPAWQGQGQYMPPGQAEVEWRQPFVQQAPPPAMHYVGQVAAPTGVPPSGVPPYIPPYDAAHVPSPSAPPEFGREAVSHMNEHWAPPQAGAPNEPVFASEPAEKARKFGVSSFLHMPEKLRGGMQGVLPEAFDFGDIVLIIVLIYLFLDSDDDDMLIILAVLAFSWIWPLLKRDKEAPLL